MTAIEKMRNNPEMTKIFAEHFARDYTGRNLETLGKGVPHSSQEVKQLHQNNSETISTKANAEIQSKPLIIHIYH